MMRILVVKLSSIGDVVHTLPAVTAIRRGLPSARIAWVVERRAAAILKDSPVLDELIEIDSRAWRKRWASGATISEIRGRLHTIRNAGEANGRAEVAIDFQGLIKSGLVTLLSGAARRIGAETSELREKASRVFLTEQVETSRFEHVIEKNLALAKAILASPEHQSGEYEFPITVSAEDERHVEAAVEGLGGGFAIINPGGGWPTKLWAAEKYGELADRLWEERGLRSLITYGPGEEALASEVAANSRSGAARVLASTLKQFVALARRAAIFVGGDTGPLHLAAACRTPIVGIYGPTSGERNGPFDRRDLAVARDLWCRADCHRRSCWHWQCMEVSVDEVMSAVSTRLAPEGQAVIYV